MADFTAAENQHSITFLGGGLNRGDKPFFKFLKFFVVEAAKAALAIELKRRITTIKTTAHFYYYQHFYYAF